MKTKPEENLKGYQFGNDKKGKNPTTTTTECDNNHEV